VAFAVSPWFWQACLVIVLLTCLNPSRLFLSMSDNGASHLKLNSYGKRIWEEFPTGKMLLEMLITRSRSFPPFDGAIPGQSKYQILHRTDCSLA